MASLDQVMWLVNSLDATVIPSLAVMTLTIAAFLIPAIGIATKSRRLVEIVAGIATLYVMLLNLRLCEYLVHDPSKRIVYLFGGWPPPIGIVYEVDLYSALLALLVSSIMFMVVLYSFSYAKDEKLYLYYALLMIAEVGMLGTLYTGDVFNLFVMLEVMSIACYALISFEKRGIALSAAAKYGLYGALATTVFLIGIAYIYGAFGTLNMADISAKIMGMGFPITQVFGAISPALIVFVFACLWVFTFKAAVFPNHFWLPDAHAEAPTPVSAMLSGLVVAVGLYAAIRIFVTVLGPAQNIVSTAMLVLLVLGLVSAYVGALAMVVENDVKRLIAYSTVMNIGLAVVGVSLLTVDGLAAALSYIVNHGVAKALAFLSIGIAISAVGSRNLEDLQGLGRVNRLMGTAFAIAMLGLGGIPPLCMFMSKLYLYLAIWRRYGALVTCLALGPSVIGFVGYARALYALCVKPPRDIGAIQTIRLGVWSSITLLILSLAVIGLGIATPMLINDVFAKASSVLMDYKGYVEAAASIATRLLHQS